MNTTHLHRYPVHIDGETVTIGTANELSAAMDVLQGQHDRQVLEQLRPHLVEIIAGPSGLISILKSLSEGDQLFLIDAIGADFARLVQHPRRLSDLLAMMSSEVVENKILETLGHTGLNQLIVRPEDLGETLEWLYGHSDKRVLELLGVNALRNIIRSGNGLAIVLDALELDAQRELLNTLGKEHVLGLISNGIELARLLRSMPAELGVSFIEEMSKEQLIKIINNAADWEYLWKRLETAEAQAMAQKLNFTYHAA